MSATASETGVRLERDGALAVLTLARPPLNLFGPELLDGLEAGVAEVAASGARGLLIRANGKVVSGGVDVEIFLGLTEAKAAALSARMLALVAAVEALALPTVFAAHARCLTAAFELALGCDLLLAAESADFGLVEARVGVTPGMGGTQRLVARAGSMRATQIVMGGALHGAAELERWGVVSAVLPDAGFAAAARAYAAALAAGPTRAHAATKAIVRTARESGVAAADAVTPAVSAPLYESADTQAAVAAFGHATPRFEGR